MDIPREANATLSALQKRLPHSLLALYLHGSAVSGCLRPHSDVDLLGVIDPALAPESGMRLAADLLEISGRYPFDPDGRRPIELILFTRSHLSAPSYPAQCAFIYGEWLRRAYETGEAPACLRDPELTLVLAQARQEAKALFGPPANELLPAIPASDIRRAIGDALPALAERFPEDERNVLLTLARMWRTLATAEFVPKDAAADWAATRLPQEHASVLLSARNAYLGLRGDTRRPRRQEARRTMRALYELVAQNL